MRKISFLIIGAIFCMGWSNQIKTSKAKKLKLITYDTDGAHNTERDEFIKDNVANYDLYFISNHFYNIPLPKALKNLKYKNQKNQFSSGNSPQSRRSFYTEYDKTSRVIAYGMSGCYICSDLGYCYNIIYNTTGQVGQLIHSSKCGMTFKNDTYKIYYSNNGDVKQIDVFTDDKLFNQIILY